MVSWLPSTEYINNNLSVFVIFIVVVLLSSILPSHLTTVSFCLGTGLCEWTPGLCEWTPDLLRSLYWMGTWHSQALSLSGLPFFPLIRTGQRMSNRLSFPVNMLLGPRAVPLPFRQPEPQPSTLWKDGWHCCQDMMCVSASRTYIPTTLFYRIVMEGIQL